MSLQLGDTAPDFTLDSTEGQIHLHDYIGKQWLVFFSHPKVFHPGVHHRAGRLRPPQGRVRPA
ncbi:hypothetical protein UU5_05593 [Rhodanobacter sp. 115]|nr:hypothetical protein UU5_05593 [Rhodanobacter sp. 115]